MQMRKVFSLLVCVGMVMAAPIRAIAAEADPLDSLVVVLKESKDPQLQLDILRGISAALKGRRSAAMPEGWNDVEPKLSASKNAEIRTLAQSLSLTFGSKKALAALQKTSLDSSAEVAVRRAAVQSLVSIRDPELPGILEKLLSRNELVSDALKALAGYDHPTAAGAVLAVYPNLSNTEKRDALNTLASRTAYAAPLLRAVEENKVARTD